MRTISRCGSSGRSRSGGRVISRRRVLVSIEEVCTVTTMLKAHEIIPLLTATNTVTVWIIRVKTAVVNLLAPPVIAVKLVHDCSFVGGNKMGLRMLGWGELLFNNNTIIIQ